MNDARLYSAAAAAAVLGIDRSRVLRIARTRGLGRREPYSGMWLFSADDVDAMKVRKPGRPAVRTP
jgi:hypothetical protein